MQTLGIRPPWLCELRVVRFVTFRFLISFIFIQTGKKNLAFGMSLHYFSRLRVLEILPG